MKPNRTYINENILNLNHIEHSFSIFSPTSMGTGFIELHLNLCVFMCESYSCVPGANYGL